MAEAGSQIALAPTAPAKGTRALSRRELIIGAGTSISGAVIAGLAVWELKPSPLQPVSRLTITLPPGQQLVGLDNGPAVAISPAGTRLAYVARQSGVQQLYLREMDSMEARAIPGTEGGSSPFFSPNGQWVGFYAGQKLKKVSVSGGAVLILGDATFPHGASWGSQRLIAFAPSVGSSPLLVTWLHISLGRKKH